MANAALGGDTCHRGSLLGAIYGCAGAAIAVPGDATVTNLSGIDDLESEIAEFSELIATTEEQARAQPDKAGFVLKYPPTAKAAEGPVVEACAS